MNYFLTMSNNLLETVSRVLMAISKNNDSRAISTPEIRDMEPNVRQGNNKNPDLSVGATLVRFIVLIDYANIKAWAKGKKVAVDMEVLIQIIQSASRAQVRFYYGTDGRNGRIESFFLKLAMFGYTIVTKPVQYFRVALLELLEKETNARWLAAVPETIARALMMEAKRLDQQGIELFAPKANFDVEIALDALRYADDYDRLVLFSGDGDFVPLMQLLKDIGKKTTVIAGRQFLSSALRDSADLHVKMEDLVRAVPELVYSISGASYKKPTPAHEERAWEKGLVSIVDLLGLSSVSQTDVDNAKVNKKTP